MTLISRTLWSDDNTVVYGETLFNANEPNWEKLVVRVDRRGVCVRIHDDIQGSYPTHKHHNVSWRYIGMVTHEINSEKIEKF